MILQRLEFVYGPDRAREVFPRVEALCERYRGRVLPRAAGWSQKDALLIAYADSILGQGVSPLRALHGFLTAHVGEAVSYVHLLPFFPFTSDDGFAVTDFQTIRHDLGDWDDVRDFAADYRLVFDGVINHVSSSGIYMKGYASGDPKYKDYFISLPPDTDTRSVLRTRNLPLLHDYATADGTKWLWTTFSRDQIDLNFRNPDVLLEILDVLLGYAANGASMIRLDAIPYMWKELGTSCAHLPQTHELIKLIRDVLLEAAPHVSLLTETNVPHRENVTYFGDRGDEAQVIYNFALAPLILWGLATGDASVLSRWAAGIEWIGPGATYLNITATHDGIGMRPTEGLLDEPARAVLVRRAKDHGGDVTGKRNSDGTISPYELNLNYFDAVNDPRSDESIDIQIKRFMVSQAIPMAMMGIPGIYIHSLLGSRNDYAGVNATGRARSINREQLIEEPLRRELAQPQSLRANVFGDMKRLLTLRAGQSAFHPDATQEILDWGGEIFAVRRHNRQTGQTIVAIHNMTARAIQLSQLTQHPGRDLLATDSDDIKQLSPYQIRWIELYS